MAIPVGPPINPADAPTDNPQRGAGAGVSAPIGPVLQTGAFRFLSAHRRVTCRLVFAIQLYSSVGFQDGLWPGTGHETDRDQENQAE